MDNEVYYVVQVMRKWESLQVLSISLSAEAAAPGCIGFLPVFKSVEAATLWRDEEHPNAGIVGIAPSEAPE